MTLILKFPIPGLVLLMMCLPLSAIGQTIHTVKSGESLSRIAGMYFSTTASYTRQELVKDIISINSITSQSLSVGQKLVVPVVTDKPFKPKTVSKKKGFNAKGVYINQWSAGSRQIFEVADRLKIYGANTIVFDAKDVRGGLSYRSSIPGLFSPVTRYPRGIEDISKLVAYLHLMDIHVVARICVFRDMLIASAMPHWRLDQDWLNPADPEVQEYIEEIVRELIHYGVDEIQLDYCRYPADSELSTGIEGRSSSDVIAEFLKRIHALTSAHGVLLSLDMFGIVIWKQDKDILSVGQDIEKIRHHVDIISPMLYPSHFSKDFAGVANPADAPYYFVSQGIKRLRKVVGQGVTIRPWLQSFPLRVTTGYGPEFIQNQISASMDSGGTGWLLWSPGNYYQEAYTAMENMYLQNIPSGDDSTQSSDGLYETRDIQGKNEKRPRGLSLGPEVF
ncbi:MAG TPA: LysM peptidoglycan-binding domain-containing protein [Deltaproteobacteria bacterium]|nr:LysM peptidoglycan-binding domain-containing protein [Deltaproteobacteria bacterium]